MPKKVNHKGNIISEVSTTKNKVQPGDIVFFNYSGKKVKAEDGKLVIFPAHVRHSVPKNKCKNRVSLIGNVLIGEV